MQKAGWLGGDEALDMGCGTGGNTPLLREYCDSVLGIDISPDAISVARKNHPGSEFTLGDINEIGRLYTPASFSLVSAFTVLYHSWVTSDIQALRDANTLLKPGGIFVLTEAAFSFLRRSHDRKVHTARRYTVPQLNMMLVEAGFVDVRATYFNLPLFPAAIGLALAERTGLNLDGDGDEVAELRMPPRWLNRGLIGLLDLELSVIKAFGKVPFGISIACVARKP
jgi:SAM-dependent methyltransferase